MKDLMKSAMRHAVRTLLPVCCILIVPFLAGAGLEASDLLEVAVMPGPGPVKLALRADTPALVTERRDLYLAKGANRLRFDWTGQRIDAGSVHIEVIGADGNPLAAGPLIRTHRSSKILYFDVDAEGAGPVEAKLTYLLSGIGWKVHYLGRVDEGETAIDLTMAMELTNGSGMELKDALAILPAGRIEGLDLDPGDSVRHPGFEAAKIPMTRRYTYDPSRFGGKVAVHLELVNDEASGLGRDDLAPGKIRLFRTAGPGGGQALLGEDILPATPRGEKARIYIGNATDVTVERKVLKSARENERRDRWNKVVAYDQRDRLRFKMKNHRSAKIDLTLVERIPGDWVMAEKGREFTRKDAGTVEYALPLEPGAEAVFEVEYVKRNLW